MNLILLHRRCLLPNRFRRRAVFCLPAFRSATWKRERKRRDPKIGKRIRTKLAEFACRALTSTCYSPPLPQFFWSLGFLAEPWIQEKLHARGQEEQHTVLASTKPQLAAGNSTAASADPASFADFKRWRTTAIPQPKTLLVSFTPPEMRNRESSATKLKRLAGSPKLQSMAASRLNRSWARFIGAVEA